MDDDESQDVDESKVGEQSEVLPNESTTPFGSGRKSLVQDFIYSTSRNSFRKSILPTDEGADQRLVIPDITNHRRSSLRLFSRLSINNAENDLTKLQSQELMYSPSFARVSSKQELELEKSKSNLQNIPQRPDGTEFLAFGRKSFQKNVRHEHDQRKIRPEDFSFLYSAAKSNDQVLEEEIKEDMQAPMELEYGAPSHEGPGDKIFNEEYGGRSSGVKHQHNLNDTNLDEDGFIIRPSYMDIHLAYPLHSVIGQLRTSSHQLQIEVGRYTRIPLEERICQLCHQGVESEEHNICHFSVFYEIRGRYHYLFKQGFGPLRKVIEYGNQRCLGLFLLELKRHRQKLLKNTATQAHPQRTITTFFSPITPTNATNDRT